MHKEKQSEQSPSARLTPREREVITLATEGHSRKEMADRLFISSQTLNMHLANIYKKLEVSNRLEAMRVARQQGLLME